MRKILLFPMRSENYAYCCYCCYFYYYHYTFFAIIIGVMSPWLFNVYMDGVVCEVNSRMLRKGVELLRANSRRFVKNQLLFADDTALVADSEEKLCRSVSEFGGVWERRKLRVNVGTSKVTRFSRYENTGR